MIFIDYLKQKGSLRLIIGEFLIEEYSSLYYWTIDRSFMPNDESERKALLNVIHVLEDWQIYLRESKISKNVALLPFDFSDEYLGFLKVDFSKNNNVFVSYCCTRTIKGYSINPSCWRNFLSKDNITVEYSSEEIEMPYLEIEKGLIHSIELIKSPP